MSLEKTNPFHISVNDLALPRWGKVLLSPFAPLLFRFLGITHLARHYEIIRGTTPVDQFIDSALKRFDVTWEIATGGVENLPKTGPVVIVSNHPFGGIEGVLLAAVLRTVRHDVKLWANYLLNRVEELRDLFIFVDPFGGPEALKKNIAPLRDSIAWLKSGGVLGTFPSGTVSHFQASTLSVSDPVWNPIVARVIRKSKATVVPIYFHGKNSLLFNIIGFLHPLLRTALLPRELVKREHSKVVLRIGKPVSFDRLSTFEDDESMMAYLRFRTYLLRNKVESQQLNFSAATPRQKKQKPIVAAQDRAILDREIESLPEEQILVESKELSVFWANASQIPFCLRELGRLRELTFRQVKEGTGKSIDIDRFDNYYIHLFTWNREKSEIAGGYRMGQTDRILEHYGIRGLYTSTLFHYKADLLEQLGPSLELGRSFVRPEYQKNYSSLLMLWKGIARYVAAHPQYRNLFGTVSINTEYESMSRQLIVAFLKAHNLHPGLTRLVRARNPLRTRPIPEIDAKTISIVVKDIHEVSELIAEIEAREHSVPVLLRHYLKLGGRLLGFNIDINFGSVVDGLILVDLSASDRKFLDLYMGKEAAKAFLQHHGKGDQKEETGTS